MKFANPPIIPTPRSGWQKVRNTGNAAPRKVKEFQGRIAQRQFLKLNEFAI